MDPETIQQTRASIKALASELVTLADTWEPSPRGGFGLEPAIVVKAKAIIAASHSPIEYAMGMAVSGIEGVALRALTYLKALDNIPATGSITLSDLATVTKSQPALLKRLLRPFVGNGLIKQDAVDTYAHTPTSLGLRSTDMGGLLFLTCFEECTDVMTQYPAYLEEKRVDGIYQEPGSGITSQTHNPCNWRLGQEGRNTYEVLAEYPVRQVRMHKILGAVEHLNPFVGFYDFSKLVDAAQPERPVFVDIGGGYGPAIAQILGAHPHIRAEQCVLQDLGAVIRDVEAGANPQLPAAVVKQAHDYFSPQPVKGARAYHLRAVAHNLSDANVLRLIEAIKPAMAPDSKILIADNVVPEQGTKGLSGFMDLMMMQLGGKERSETEFRELLTKAGLKLDAIHRAPGERNYAIVEASLA